MLRSAGTRGACLRLIRCACLRAAEHVAPQGAVRQSLHLPGHKATEKYLEVPIVTTRLPTLPGVAAPSCPDVQDSAGATDTHGGPAAFE